MMRCKQPTPVLRTRQLDLNLSGVADVRSEMAATPRSGMLWKTGRHLWDDFEKEMVWHVYKNVTAEGMLQSHIKDQVTRLHKMWKA
jgi:hypothetical protein